MFCRRIVTLVVVALVVTCLLPAGPALAADGSDRTYAIHTTVADGEFYSFEQHTVGQRCVVHIELSWVFDGNMTGTAIGEYNALVYHPCGDFPGGTYSEVADFNATFQGTVDGRSGTFRYAGHSRYRTSDGIWHGEIHILPGSGTGDLAGIYGFMKGASLFTEPTPYTGWYRLMK